jgi:iron complex transport system substrate-binding protein
MTRTFVAAVLGLAALATSASMQGRFVDDAGRAVVLPARVSRVFAAGAPAEVMLHTLAPELLVGRNRVPEGEAVEFFPPAYRNPTLIRQLPEFDNPKADAELVALKPDIYVDYGTVNPDYVESLEAVQRRTGVPGIVLDGALARVPDAYRRLGSALGVSARGQQRGDRAERLLSKYRDALAKGSSAVRVYLACSADGYVPCLADESGGEQLRWLGGINVAGTRAAAPRRPLTIDEIKALAPEVVITTGAAARLRADPAWQAVDAVTKGRVYQWPALPYSWGPRPPSVNRLPGVAWLSYVVPGRPLDAEFERDVRMFYEEFYHLQLTNGQLEKLVSQM